MYGVKVGSKPVIIVANHEVSAMPSGCASLTARNCWCTMSDCAQLGERRVNARGDFSGYLCVQNTRKICSNGGVHACPFLMVNAYSWIAVAQHDVGSSGWKDGSLYTRYLEVTKFQVPLRLCLPICGAVPKQAAQRHDHDTEKTEPVMYILACEDFLPVWIFIGACHFWTVTTKDEFRGDKRQDERADEMERYSLMLLAVFEWTIRTLQRPK